MVDGLRRLADALGPIGIVLGAGLVLRLALIYVVFPGLSGFGSDIGWFIHWSDELQLHGPASFYDSAGFVDYPPGYLYLLWAMGGLSHFLASALGAEPQAVLVGIIKLPAVLADVAAAFVIYRLARFWMGERPDGERLAVLAAALYLFNPISWYDSAVWGQVDAVGALIILVAIALLVHGQSEGAAGMAAMAAVAKPQFGLLLVPLVAAVLLRRHLLFPGSGPSRVGLPRALDAWIDEPGPWRLVSSAATAFVVLFVLVAPFGLDLFGYLDLVRRAADLYPYLSVNAYNVWALVGAGGVPPLAGTGQWSSDLVPLVGQLPGVAIGGVLLAAAFVTGFVRLLWRDDPRSLVLVATFLGLSFFVLPTRVHERYAFPAFAFLPLLVVLDRRWLVPALMAAGATFINLHGILTKFGTPDVAALPLGEAFRTPFFVAISAAASTAAFAFALWELRFALEQSDTERIRLYLARARAALGQGARAIGLLLLGGFLLRLFIAYVLLPGAGFESDRNAFVGWSMTLSQAGPGDFYAQAGFADYPPGFLYVLWFIGGLAGALAEPLGRDAAGVVGDLIKLPAIAADLAIAYLLYRLAGRVRGPDGLRLGLAAAALYLFLPLTWYDSALWGQIDSVGALAMLIAVALLMSGYSEGAVAATVLAGLVKPQFGVVLLPVVAVVLFRRHVLRPGSGPRPDWAPTRLRAWLVEEQGPRRFAGSVAVGLAVLLIAIVPFALSPLSLLGLLSSAAGEYPWLSVNAYNPWALVGAGGPSLAAGGGWSSDTVPLFGPLPGVAVGSIALAFLFLYGARLLLRGDTAGRIVMVVVFLALAFFVVPTRVHERYIFPAFAFLPLLAVRDRRWLLATVALCGASLINFHGVLTTPLYGTPNVDDLPMGEAFRSFGWIAVSVAAVVAVLIFVAREARRGVDVFALPVSAPARWVSRRPVTRSASGPTPASPEVLDRPPREALVSLLVTIIGPIRRRLALRPIRADLSRTLHWEPPGRLDRLDLLIAALVVIAALTTRTWRLEQPYDMHFDEVYHARTATEFLQDWRYGIPHDIYEYTHPHLAKYLIAAGIGAFGNNHVTGQSNLDGPVASAAIEPRWSPPENLARRDGDRLYVSTGTAVRIYDLRDRNLVAQVNSPAVALAVDTAHHVLYLGARDGTLSALQTAGLDLLRSGATAIPAPGPIRQVDGTPQRLTVTPAGETVMATLPGGRLVAMSTETGEITGSTTIEGAAGIVSLSNVDVVVADPTQMSNEAVAAGRLAAALQDDTTRIQQLLRGKGARVVLSAFMTDERRAAVQKAIDAGELPGVDIQSQSAIAVANSAGVAVLDGASLQRLGSAAVGKATGLALMGEGLDKPTLYVAVGSTLQLVEIASNAPPRSNGLVRMPGPVSDVAWDPSSGLIHALGQAPSGATGAASVSGTSGGASDTGSSGPTVPTIYVVEPHGNAVFADARLPFAPQAWLMDAQPERPSDDRQQILALSADGQLATVDVGSNAFGWRFVGVIAGALMAGCLYVLGRLLFRRRSVALIAAALALVDGMFFVNARIAMNDTYVAFFIVAAFTAFALLYMEHWRGPSALLVGIPLVAVLLGLALASKWVGAYAIGAVLLLVLLRSALGRLLALAGMIGLSGLLGYLAIAVPSGPENPQRNVLFLVLLVALTVLLGIAIVVRPVRMTPAEHRYAFAAMFGTGALTALAGLLLRASLPGDGLLTFRNLLILGTLLMLSGAGTLVAPRIGQQLGFRPFAAPAPGEVVDPPSPAPSGWLNPGWARGIPWTWALGCLAVIPLVVYVISYIPWAMPWHPAGPRLADAWPLIGTWPPGHTGQTLLDLQVGMYDYHNNLRATHAASSPWWAWPLDLKPVWFYSQSFGEGGTGLIYDAGNMVAFWLAIPAMAWAAWQAWKRRSLALTFLVITVAALWLPWARIDRATFQYHIFTSLPFAFLALAYFLAELWHGPGRGTWALARLAGAGALILPAFMWLTRPVLCGLAATEKVRPGGQACGSVTEQFVLSERWAVALLIGVIGLGAVLWQWYSLRRRQTDGMRTEDGHDGRPTEHGDEPRSETNLARRWLALTAVAAIAAVSLALLGLSERSVVAFTIGDRSPYLVALVALVVLAIPALFILEARDPRRFVVVALGAAALWFLAFYPYLSGLPVPPGIAAWYQTLPLPTWNYDFQFAVNVDPPFRAQALLPSSVALAAGVGALCVAAMYAANAWRLELARRRYERAAEAAEPAEA